MILLRIAHSGFSLHELATIIGQEYKRTIDHKTVLNAWCELTITNQVNQQMPDYYVQTDGSTIYRNYVMLL
jgi:hypothetical protein